MRISDWSSDVCSSDLNGLRSTEAHIGNEFRRVRIGIGHPGNKAKVHGYVLGNYAKVDIDALSDMLGAIGAEADWLARGDDARFMNDVALRLPESEPSNLLGGGLGSGEHLFSITQFNSAGTKFPTPPASPH